MADNDGILRKLGERVKELTALHQTARFLQDEKRAAGDVMADVVNLLPPAWQYPEITHARLRFHDIECTTPGFGESPWMQKASFAIRGGYSGSIEVFYAEEKSPEFEGPFLAEERDLIESLAEMLRSYFQHKLADEALMEAHDNLERQVMERTAELQTANEELQLQISELRKAEKQIRTYQRQLRKLAAELSMAEARERREIAADVHDHIGQALAFVKMKLTQLQGDAVFCGFEGNFGEILSLVEQTITYTRTLTFEISPPVLYELGLVAALEWLAETSAKKYQFAIDISTEGRPGILRDEVQVALFKAVQELIVNAAKHARAERVTIHLAWGGKDIRIVVADDGIGIDTAILEDQTEIHRGFGLFSIRERFAYLGGAVQISSLAGKGTEISLHIPYSSEGGEE